MFFDMVERVDRRLEPALLCLACLADANANLTRVTRSQLDRLQLAAWGKAINGNCHAVDRVLAVMARRANILGIGAPRRVSVSGEVTMSALAERAAEGTSLDVGSIIAESERILTDDLETGDAS